MYNYIDYTAQEILHQPTKSLRKTTDLNVFGDKELKIELQTCEML